MQSDPTQHHTRPKHAGYSGLHVITPGGFFSKLLGVLGAIVLLVLVFAFSLILLAVVAVAAILIWGYLKYRASALRRAEARGDFDVGGARGASGQGRSQQSWQTHADSGSPIGGLIIEGEVVRDEPPAGEAPKPR